MRIADLPSEVLGFEEMDRLRVAGVYQCEQILFLGDGQLKDLTKYGEADRNRLRAAASLAVIPGMSEELLRTCLAIPLHGGAISFIQADPGELAKAIEAHAVYDTPKLKSADVLAMQNDAAEALLRIVLGQLSSKGWATQLAAFVAPDDATVKQLQQVLQTCGAFPKARPLLERIERLFDGFGSLFGAGAAIRSTIDAVQRRPDEMERRQKELGRELALKYGGWPPSPGIQTLVGITPEAVDRLAAAGYETVHAFRVADLPSLAEQTEIPLPLLERLKLQADLQIRPGVSPSLAYTLVDYDEVARPKLSARERMLDGALAPGSWPGLADGEYEKLITHGEKLLKAGKIPQHPFPVLVGLGSQQTLEYIWHYQTDMQLKNVVLDPLGDSSEENGRIAMELASALEMEWMGKGAAHFPFTPLFFEKTPESGSNAPPSPEQRVQFAKGRNAAFMLVLDGDPVPAEWIIFPGRDGQLVRFAVVDGHTQGNEFEQRYYPWGRSGGGAELPRYYFRVEQPGDLWTYVTANFQLREFISDQEPAFAAHGSLIREAERPSDGRLEVIRNAFPLHLPVALAHTIHRVQALRDAINLREGDMLNRIGLSVSSGYRSPKHPLNARRRGSSGSPHQWGTAVDLNYISGQKLSWEASTRYRPDPISYVYSVALGLDMDFSRARYPRSYPRAQHAGLDQWAWVETEHFQVSQDPPLPPHAHLDTGAASHDLEREICRRYGPALGVQPIHIAIAKDPKLTDARTFADALFRNLKATVAVPGHPGMPPSTVSFQVTTPQRSEHAVLAKAAEAGIPAVMLRLGPAGAELTRDIQKRQVLARSVLAAILEGLDRKLGLISGTVLGQDGSGQVRPLQNATVRLFPARNFGATQIDPADVQLRLYPSTLTDSQGKYALYAVIPQNELDDGKADVQIQVTQFNYAQAHIEYAVKRGENVVEPVTLKWDPYRPPIGCLRMSVVALLLLVAAGWAVLH